MTETKNPTAVFILTESWDAALVDSVLHHTFPQVRNWQCELLVPAPGGGTKEISSQPEGAHSKPHFIEPSEPPGSAASLHASRKYAITTLHAKAIVEVDETVMQMPDAPVSLLRSIEEGADLALGSRGSGKRGKRPSGSGWFVRLLTRIILFFPTKAWFRVTDPTTALRAYRVAENDPLFAEIQSSKEAPEPVFDLAYRMIRQKRRVVEIPLDRDPSAPERVRKGGAKSLHYLGAAFRLRWRDPETKRFVKFGVVGFTGYVINASALELFRNIRLSYSIASFFAQFPRLGGIALLTSQSAWSAGLAAELAILSNYLLNNFWTFSSHTIRSPWRFIGKMLQFNLTSFGAVIIQFLVIGLATILFGDTPAVRGVALVVAVVFLIVPYNWTVYNRLIWRVKKKRDAI
jgi:putative flippase GtrA